MIIVIIRSSIVFVLRPWVRIEEDRRVDRLEPQSSRHTSGACDRNPTAGFQRTLDESPMIG
jgi:hypothetical protein